MLLLVTILLVLVAAVTLLIGIFSDELWLIFVSIGASALAAIVLAVLSQVSRRKGRAATTATAPEPLPARQDTATATAAAAASSIAEVGEPVPTAAEVAEVADAPTETVEAVPEAGAMPIADYDALRVNEILPKLQTLDLDELETVAIYEEAHKNRSTVLNTIDKRMDELEAADGAPAADATTTDELATEAVASIEEIGEPVVALDEPAVASPDGAVADGFPIPNYDDLSADELIPLLQGLDADQLETVADREEAGQNRDAVLDAIDDRLDVLEGIVPVPAAAAAEPVTTAPVATAPARAVAAKKASAKKATPAKKASAKKAAAVPVKKAATKKAPAKRTLEPAEKAPAATAKKTATKAATATTKAAKKAVPAKKATTAKKASAAKKATKR